VREQKKRAAAVDFLRILENGAPMLQDGDDVSSLAFDVALSRREWLSGPKSWWGTCFILI
jgi:hypothetical protein